jgi:transcriptional regulator with XRE-family HTH domain
MNEPALPINGALLRQRREAKGWAQTDLATRACLSLRQVRQIEDGGNSSFYSESVKATAARKIATLLGLSSESAFVQAQAATDAVHPAADGLTPSDTEHAPAPVLAPVVHAPGPAAGADLSSVMTHVAVATADIDPPPPQSLSSDGAQGESRSSSFLWIALLAVAVGAGVLLMPKSSDVSPSPSMSAPVDPNPPAPPPMVLPADAVEASGNQPTDASMPPARSSVLPAASVGGSGAVGSATPMPMPNAVSAAPAPPPGPAKAP